MYKLLLSWRYLRTRYIALASIISVTLGVATLIVVNSVMAGFTHEMHKRMHGILSDVRYRTLSGTAVARDFVEGLGGGLVVQVQNADCITARCVPRPCAPVRPASRSVAAGPARPANSAGIAPNASAASTVMPMM